MRFSFLLDNKYYLVSRLKFADSSLTFSSIQRALLFGSILWSCLWSIFVCYIGTAKFKPWKDFDNFSLFLCIGGNTIIRFFGFIHWLLGFLEWWMKWAMGYWFSLEGPWSPGPFGLDHFDHCIVCVIFLVCGFRWIRIYCVGFQH